MSNDILFDNFIVTDNKRVADQWAADSWQLKQGEENAAAVSPHTSHIHVLGQKTAVVVCIQIWG